VATGDETGQGPSRPRELAIRAARPGDHGWQLERHAHLYADEEGWGDEFLALIARVVADYLDSPDPEREGAWIAELDGQRAGGVYCTRADERTAQLRLLLVEPWARGAGLGRRLVDHCVDFARESGYERIVLWTNSSLTSARRIYDAAGFEQISESTDPVFPDGTLAQKLALDLT
jgi:GNAT superfamily N-acetyltransferase